MQLYLLPIIAMVGVSMRFDNQYIKTGLAACASLYCAVLVAKALLPYPYMWIISTQNLQTVEAVMKDPKPVVATSYYYCLTSWRYDNRPDILFVGEREAPNTEFSYGPCTSKYRYLTDRKVDDFVILPVRALKMGMQSSINRFMRSELPVLRNTS